MSEKFIPQSRDGVSPLKRVAAIHDLSCFGRCALTVIMPTLSAMGVQVVPIPTCLLSTHTGGFTDMSFEDLSGAMEKIAAHFDTLDMRFDAIYTGFLGSYGQIETVRAFIDRFADEQTLVLVDTVMGDGGELYSTYTEQMMKGMSRLCHSADIITPNLTEACFLTDTPYLDTAKMSDAEFDGYVGELCDKLQSMNARTAVITGLHRGEDRLCVAGKDYFSGELYEYSFERVEKDYPGTGDLFASVLLGALMRGEGLDGAIKQAADFTRRVMEYSSRFATADREGVAFEAFLGELAHASPTL